MTDNEAVILIDLLNGEGCTIESKAELAQLIDLFVSLKKHQARVSGRHSHLVDAEVYAMRSLLR